MEHFLPSQSAFTYSLSFRVSAKKTQIIQFANAKARGLLCKYLNMPKFLKKKKNDLLIPWLLILSLGGCSTDPVIPMSYLIYFYNQLGDTHTIL